MSCSSCLPGSSVLMSVLAEVHVLSAKDVSVVFVVFGVSAIAAFVADLAESMLEVFAESRQIVKVVHVEFDANDSQSQSTKLRWKSMLVFGVYAAAVFVTVV